MQELVAYHATKSSNINSILTEGFNSSISTNKKSHWLGKGIYFYEDLYYAVEWCYLGIIKENVDYDKLNKVCGIITATIDVNKYNLLDLNSGLGYDAYISIIKSAEDLCDEEDKKELKSGEDIKIIRVIEKIEKQVGIKLFSSFDIVSALYPKNVFQKKNDGKIGNFFTGMQKQICVKNQEAIISKKEYDMKNKSIKKINELIINNRRKIK